MPKPYRSKAYLKWVKSLPCCVTGKQADDPHHIIGYGMGGMGTKASDMFAFPLTRQIHTELHDKGYKEFESRLDTVNQVHYVGLTLVKAIEAGKLTEPHVISEINGQTMPHHFRKELFRCLSVLSK